MVGNIIKNVFRLSLATVSTIMSGGGNTLDLVKRAGGTASALAFGICQGRNALEDFMIEGNTTDWSFPEN
jgi:hypothetical protein